MNFKMTAPCHFGLEKTLSFEIKRAGGTNIICSDGRVTFDGDETVLIKSNISCSVAERIGIVLAEFNALTFDDVFDNVKKIHFFDYAEKDAKFPVVKGQSINSRLTSIPALQRTVKKALVDSMSEHYGVKSFYESGTLYPVRFFLHKDRMTVFLDTSGSGLHKRGYRAVSNAAPIKETLAAGLIDLAKIRSQDILADPFCGSGTILIEAALKAYNIPPCLNRDFISMDWNFLPKNLWQDCKNSFKENIKTDIGFIAYGYDNNPDCVQLTQDNAKKAGVSDYIKVEKRDIRDFEFPNDVCKIITNPPYAERMMTESEVEVIYKIMGDKLLNSNNRLFIINGNEKFETFFGKKAEKNRKLYNGMLMCRYYFY